MRIRDGLVTSQIALSIVLLIGAGLMVKSIIKLNASDPGFDAHNVLTMHLTLPESKYPTPEQKRIFFKRAVAAVSSIPGVRSSALALTLPLSAAKPRAAVLTDGSPVVPLAQRPFVYWQAITPEYFHVMGIRLLRGREFDEHDDENGATVAIINEAMAKRFWSDRGPIGKQIMIATQLHPKIVGIIKDVDTGELGGSTGPEVYTPYSQWPIGSGTLVVRTVPEPRSMLSSVISSIATIDKDEPVSQVETMEEIVAGSLGNRRLMSFVLLAFALVCLVLGIIGVYGATTYWIRTRMHELAIRTILGACPRDITRLVLQKGLRLVCGGVIIGLAAALAFTQLMRSLLFGVSTHDPTIFCLAAITFTLIAVTTIYIPTRKVANADPLLFLRKSL